MSSFFVEVWHWIFLLKRIFIIEYILITTTELQNNKDKTRISVECDSLHLFSYHYNKIHLLKKKPHNRFIVIEFLKRQLINLQLSLK
jgi:hypothetical protein